MDEVKRQKALFKKWCPIKIIDAGKAPKAVALRRAYWTAWEASAKVNRAVELRQLLKEAVRLFKAGADYWCGNSEGTPCDDHRPRYVCKYHRWLKKARRAVREYVDQS